MRDESSVLPPDYSDSLPLSSYAEDIDAITGATSAPHSDVNIQPHIPWLTTLPFGSDEEEEPSLQEVEAALTPVRHKSEIHYMEKEIRQLRQDMAGILEELRQFKVLYKDMQNLTVNQQTALLVSQPQRVMETPFPLPRTIYTPLEAVEPEPYTPQPSPRRSQVPHSKSHLKSEIDTNAYLPNLQYPPPMGRLQSAASPGMFYRGPHPTIPDFTSPDPREFTHLKFALNNILPPDATELFKYQILLGHLKFTEACLIADSFLNSSQPYTDTMNMLNNTYGLPFQLALTKIAEVMEAPNVEPGDLASFNLFALRIQALVGLLNSLGSEGDVELRCALHAARLLTKLPPDLRASFKRHLPHQKSYTLPDLAEWLKLESWWQYSENLYQRKDQRSKMVRPKPGPVVKHKLASGLHGADRPPETVTRVPTLHQSEPVRGSEHSRPLCPYCQSTEHYLSQCTTFQAFSTEQMIKWIKDNKRCWKCGRLHLAKDCTLKKPCHLCSGKHLRILHEVNSQPQRESTC
ncbi:uncharacterized protein LOC124400481 [Silurus meridionalis]|uniref:uncharacterized protein LOC124400481 n=1 Tax=Silurus meridionalis TaxID=175797 RepID=UPI001EEA5E3E|nr:uncharacterized protein LOC124400481 [Silurus meridionalis]